MKWLTWTSSEFDLRGVLDQLKDSKEAPDVGFLFLCGRHGFSRAALEGQLMDRYQDLALLGCNARSTFTDKDDLMEGDGFSLMLGWLPGVEIRAFAGPKVSELPGDDASPALWHDRVGHRRASLQVLLCTGFTAAEEAISRGLDAAFPGTPRLGACVTGSARCSAYVSVGGEIVDSHYAGLSLHGPMRLRRIFSQRYATQGKAAVVTGTSEEGDVLELDGEPVLEFLDHQVVDWERRNIFNRLYAGVGSGLALRPKNFLFYPPHIDYAKNFLRLAKPVRRGQILQFFTLSDNRIRLEPQRADDKACLLFNGTPGTCPRPPIPTLGLVAHRVLTGDGDITLRQEECLAGYYLG